MVDRNMQRFYGRLGQIERTHAAGDGFEAKGTLGKSYYKKLRKPVRRRSGILGPLVLALLTIVALKVAVHTAIGADAYQDRILALQSGGLAGKVGAYVLQADPVTLTLSDRLRSVIF